MTASARKEHALGLFAGIAGDYDRWAQILSFGQDARWHRRMIEALGVGRDDLVADVATGTAAVAIDLVRRYGCRVVGIDQSAAMLERGRSRVAAAGLGERIELVEGEAERLPLEDASVDALTHTYLLRYVDDPAATLRELARVVRPGGAIASLDFAVPAAAGTRRGGPGRESAAVRRARRRRRLVRDRPVPGRKHRGVLARASAGATVLAMWDAAGIGSVRWRVLSRGGGVIIRGRNGGNHGWEGQWPL